MPIPPDRQPTDPWPSTGLKAIPRPPLSPPRLPSPNWAAPPLHNRACRVEDVFEVFAGGAEVVSAKERAVNRGGGAVVLEEEGGGCPVLWFPQVGHTPGPSRSPVGQPATRPPPPRPQSMPPPPMRAPPPRPRQRPRDGGGGGGGGCCSPPPQPQPPYYVKGWGPAHGARRAPNPNPYPNPYPHPYANPNCTTKGWAPERLPGPSCAPGSPARRHRPRDSPAPGRAHPPAAVRKGEKREGGGHWTKLDKTRPSPEPLPDICTP